MKNQSTPQKQLTAAELASLREIHISIDFKGLRKAWTKILYEAPLNLYQGTMRFVEKVSRKLMTGPGSLLSMPTGIILRNASRAAHNSNEHSFTAFVGGVAALTAVAGATLLGGPLLATALPAVVSGFIGTIGTYVAAGIAASLVLITPAFTVGRLVSSTASALLVGVASIGPAAVNLMVAARRSKFSAKGYKFTDADVRALEEQFDRESPSARHERENLERATSALSRLPEERRQEIYQSLKRQFEEAAAKEQEQAAAASAPSARRRSGVGVEN